MAGGGKRHKLSRPILMCLEETVGLHQYGAVFLYSRSRGSIYGKV